MTPVAKLTVALIASLLVMGWIIFKTYTSGFSKDRKIVVYIITLLMPLVGLIIYLIFRRHSLRSESRPVS